MNSKFYITKIVFAAAIIAASAFTLTSCHKDGSSTTSTTISEADAAQVATDAVSPSTGGMVSQVSSSASLFSNATVTGGTVNAVNNHLVTDSYTLPCGKEKDSTVSYASATTGVPSFTYSLSWKYTLACTVPSTLTLNFTGAGTYNGFIQSSSFNSNGGFVLTGLGASSSQFTFNSNYSRTGTTISKIGNKNTFNHTLTITSSNIVYDKTTKEIVSGTATVSIQVTSTSGKSWSYGGTLTFLGNKTAKLVLNSGTVYNISWS
ncbi:MAG TPA: hypothetical protein VFE53_14860 [Mucilaginibacter sp.]|jgi:hypothetical protein|nr:hypothetical protein [Mucilaginibacter sp.]